MENEDKTCVSEDHGESVNQAPSLEASLDTAHSTKEHFTGLIDILRKNTFPANLGKAFLYDLRCGGLRGAIYFSIPYLVHNIFKEHLHLDNLCDTVWVYSFLRIFGLKEEVAAPLAIAIGNGTEVMQRQGWFAGTYDPEDFLYFTLGGLAAYAVDKSVHALISLKREYENLEAL